MIKLDEEDLPWIGHVLDIIERSAGEPWRVALDRLDDVAVAATRLAAVIGAIRRVLGGTRHASLARQTRALVLGAPAIEATARAARIAAAARTLAVSPDEIERALWSDLARERPVELREGRPNPLEIAALGNVHLVQRALRRAQAIRIRARGDAGAILRAAAVRGLLTTASIAGDGVTVLDIVGPLALCHRTTVYGRALAGLVPQLATCDHFELELAAGSRIERVRSPLLLPPPPPPSPYSLAARLADDLEQLGIAVRRAPPPIAAGASLACPDLGFEHHSVRWWLEIVGFWTADYLSRKLDGYGGANVILCIDDPDLSPAGNVAHGRRGSIDDRDLGPAGSAAHGRRGSIDDRDLGPAGSAAYGRRGSTDDRDLGPAGSAAYGRRGSTDDRDLGPAGSAARGCTDEAPPAIVVGFRRRIDAREVVARVELSRRSCRSRAASAPPASPAP